MDEEYMRIDAGCFGGGQCRCRRFCSRISAKKMSITSTIQNIFVTLHHVHVSYTYLIMQKMRDLSPPGVAIEGSVAHGPGRVSLYIVSKYGDVPVGGAPLFIH